MLSFTLETLKDLDGGKAQIAFDKHVRRAVSDCLDRAGDQTARKVTLEMSVVPIANDDGTCDEVRVQLQASSAVPKHRTKEYSFRAKPSGALLFNPDSPDNANQSTLYPDEG